MKNNLLLPFTIFIFLAILLVGCSSCSGSHQRARASDASELDSPPNFFQELDEQELSESSAPEGSGEARQIPSNEICPLGNTSYCFINREIEEFINENICLMNSSRPTDETSLVGTSFADTNRRIFSCSGFLGLEDSRPYDLIIISLDDIVFLVGEIHYFDTVGELALSMVSLRSLYNSSCDLIDGPSELGDLFECDFNSQVIFVSISGSTEDNNMIINYISDIKKFSDTLLLFDIQ